MRIYKKSRGAATPLRAYKSHYTRETIWGDVVQKWPTQYRSRFQNWLSYKRAEFAYAALWASTPEPMAYITAMNHAKGTDYMPRDVLVSLMYANFYEIKNEDGFVWPRVRDMAQNPQLILDLVTFEEGAMLYRAPQGWIAIPPGNQGQVLAFLANAPTWQDVYPIAIQNADFLVKTADVNLPSARVVGDSASVFASWSSPGAVTFKRAALTGDVTAALDDNATTIAAAAVSYSKIQNVSTTARVLGRKSSGAGTIEELDSADLAGMIGAGGGGIWQTPYFNNANIYLTPFSASSTSITTHLCVANNIRFVPFIVPWSRTFTSIAFRIPTGGAIAASNARLGIYNLDTSTGGPGSVALDAGNVATATIGVKTITINQALNPGTYFFALWTSAAITVNGYNASSSINTVGTDMLSGTMSPQNFLNRNAAFGTAFANESANAHALSAGNVSTPIVGIR